MTWKTPGLTLDLKLSEDQGCAVGSNGNVTFVKKIPHGHAVLCHTTISELLYIVQEYQEHNGGTIPVKVNLSEWRGMSGTPE